MIDNIRKQWDELKAKHPEALLLFRCGDFYEAYCEDAKECANILGITLTWRPATKSHTPGDYSDAMAAFPYHTLDQYLPKLIKAGKRVAICDQLEDPKTKERVNSKPTTTMTTNMKAADLIGKVLILGDGSSKYVIKSAEGDKLQCDFVRGESAPVQVPMTLSQIETMLANSKGYWEGDSPNGEPDPDAAGEPAVGNVETVEEVSTITPQRPVVIPMEKPKAEKKSAKPKKQDKPKEKAEIKQMGTLKYETYTNKKGKVCARIVGLNEDDAAYRQAADLHASGTYERTNKGDKVYVLIFGPRYADAAKEVCEALNAGKTMQDCQAIIDTTTEERQQKREEWKSRREEYKAQARATDEPKATALGYSPEDVAKILKDVMNGGKLPRDIETAMAKIA